jgi:hypothetical protein
LVTQSRMFVGEERGLQMTACDSECRGVTKEAETFIASYDDRH